MGDTHYDLHFEWGRGGGGGVIHIMTSTLRGNKVKMRCYWT